MGLIKINDMIISTTTNVYVLLSSKKQSTLFIEKSRAGFSKNELWNNMDNNILASKENNFDVISDVQCR